MNEIPSGRGKLSTAIRDLDSRVKRLEPRSNPGTLISIDPTGVNERPRNLLMGKASSKSKSAPRYR